MIKKYMIGLIVLLFFTACSTKSDYTLLQTATAKKTLKETLIKDSNIEYRILAQDRLDISLYRDPTKGIMRTNSNELSQTMKTGGILVNTLGYVNLPLVGNIKVVNLTQTEASRRITQAYKKYLKTPSVSVEVMNKRLFVLGEVNKPGVVPIDREKMTIFEALAFAGDIKDSAVRTDIVIISNTPKGMKIRNIDLTNFDTMDYNSLLLRPNDIVYVQADGWKKFKVASDNFISPFETITKIASPFLVFHYLGQ